MTEFANCPNCNSETSGAIKLLDARAAQAINVFTINKSSAFCTRCSSILLRAAWQSRALLKQKVTDDITADLPSIPVVTAQHPDKWEYTVLRLVTAQSVTGDGALTEFLSSFSEIFGTRSTRMANKLKNGENICISQLRMEAFRAGGNAVIACDIDFAQVGDHLKGLLMVCMAGTAVKLNNLDVLSGDMNTVFSRLYDNMAKLEFYNSFDDVFAFYSIT